MGSYRTPIKHDLNLKNIVYIFLGDANLAMRIEMSVVHKPNWYDKKLSLTCCAYDIQYAAWDGHNNLLHVPSSKRTHSLMSLQINKRTFTHNGAHDLFMEINAIDDFDTPDIPEFSSMTPLEVIRVARSPVPQRLDISWRVWHDVSTLEMSAVSQEVGITVDSGERKRQESDPNYLDDLSKIYGLSNIT